MRVSGHKAAWFSVVAAIFSGCATIQKDGFTIFEVEWEQASNAVLTRAAFDLQCPREQITLTALTQRAEQVGASGCGRQGVYVATPSGWVLNSKSDKVE